jgi:NAD(P)-dependent dehydrogenase (short-subunit alcohol dehydrogenase family)
LEEADRVAWLRMAAINFTGVLLGIHAALRRRGGGVVVNTSSIAGVIAYLGNPVYAATKAGVLGFTRALRPLAAEANIRVNCICPERVDTPLLRGAVGTAAPAGGTPTSEASPIPLIAPETVAEVVLEIIRDDSLAGQAIKISPGVAPERLDFPDFGVVRG